MTSIVKMIGEDEDPCAGCPRWTGYKCTCLEYVPCPMDSGALKGKNRAADKVKFDFDTYEREYEQAKATRKIFDLVRRCANNGKSN